MMIKETACSFLQMLGLWCDIFNIIVGVSALVRGIAIAGIGYLVVHLASILYLVFHKKLGFKYHQTTTRSLLIIPEVFLVIYMSLLFDTSHYKYLYKSQYQYYSEDLYHYYTDETFELEISMIYIGFAWSIVCGVSSLISFYCTCTPRSRGQSGNTTKNQGK